MLNEAEYFVKNEAKDVPEVQQSIDAIVDYIVNGDYHESKNERLEALEFYEGDLFELVISVFTVCLQGQHTYQSLIGMLAGKIPLKSKLDRIQTMAEIIAVIGSTGLIRITKMGSGEAIIIDTEYTQKGIPIADRHGIVFKAPKHITTNSTDEEGSMMLGSRFNYHDGDICLDHLNRMNAIELKLNIPFLMKVKEEPKKLIEDPEQQHQWDVFVKGSLQKYLEIGRKVFHQLHKYCTRGRCYSVGYHVNYQGSSFKKAVVMLAKEEVVHA